MVIEWLSSHEVHLHRDFCFTLGKPALASRPLCTPPEHPSALTAGGRATQRYTSNPKIIILDQTAVRAATALRLIPKLQASWKY